MITLISDVLLSLAALSAGLYCLVLSRRLKRMQDLDHGLGQVVKSMSVQVEQMTDALKKARVESEEAQNAQAEITARAQKTAHHLELLIASFHDVPETSGPDIQTHVNGTYNQTVQGTKQSNGESPLMFIRHTNAQNRRNGDV